MSEECTHDCSTCKSDCSAKEDNRFKTNNLSKVKKTIGVFSAKGGVGKSSVTAMLAVLMNRRGHKTAVLDADLTGPSIPKAFGLKNGVEAQENMIFPAITKKGIEVMSINLLLEDEGSPVIWRGPVLGGVIRQFYEETCWNEVDYMFVDMPPGTGDVPLTVFQSLPLDGIVIVTSPQELVSMIVSKAVNMASLMNIRVLGLVENMSYVLCPDCGRHIDIFGAGKTDAVAAEFGFDLLARIPLDARLAALCDKGALELMENDYLKAAADKVESIG